MNKSFDYTYESESLSEILYSFHVSTKLSVVAYDTAYRCIEQRYTEDLDCIAHYYIQGYFPDIHEQFNKQTTCQEEFILMSDHLGLSYAVMGIWKDGTIHGLTIIGPVIMGKQTRDGFMKQVKKMPGSIRKKITLSTLYDKIPKVDEYTLRASCKVLLGMLYSKINYFNAHAMDTVELKCKKSLPSGIDTLPVEELKRHQDFFSNIMAYAKKGDKEQIQRILTRRIRESSDFPMEEALDEKKFMTSWLLNYVSLPLIELGICLEEVGRRILTYQKEINNCSTTTELAVIAEKILDELLDEALYYQERMPLLKPIEQVILYIRYHLNQELTLQVIAKEVHLSPKYLSRLFNESVGISLSAYINEERIKKAKELLDYTGDELSEIALAVGFKNQNYFTTVFKKYTGITPKQYRMHKKSS